jgi:hypothetical protein
VAPVEKVMTDGRRNRTRDIEIEVIGIMKNCSAERRKSYIVFV